MQNVLRGLASCGLLLALGGCPGPATDAVPPGPSVATATASVGFTGLALSPTSVVINAPYTYGGYPTNGLANSTALAGQAAGYPTAALFSGKFSGDGGRDATGSELIWTSSNPEIVTVDDQGMVRSVDVGTSGTVTITARSKSQPNLTATASVVLNNDGKLALELN